jgi:hypothetical protein
MLDLEELDDEALEAARVRYQTLADGARRRIDRGAHDTDTPEA